MDLSEQPEGEFLRHPWEVARAEFFLGELRRARLVDAGSNVLDVGSGDAWFARQVAETQPAARITCWDLGYEDAVPAPTSGIEFTSAAPTGPFDVCLMLDVAEHVEDDHSFVRDVVSRVGTGGHVLFSVPAWQSLYSQHDEALRHYRRYRPAQARDLLTGAGLEVLRSGGLFHSLLIPRALQKWTEGKKADGEKAPPPDLAWRGGSALRGAVLGALAVDRVVTKMSAAVGVNVPGLSWWALCRKSG